MTPDSELLDRYARTRSEDAFAELVRRHVNLVYSAALRQVNGDAHLAQDVAQTVFTDLARKADSLARRESLTGWLYTSAHYAAAKIARTENRRRDREEKFMREPTQENEVGRVTPCAPDWKKIRPALDDAMHELKETDREAILLRYFENRQFAEVGARLGLSENTARMRVERALEKLRAVFVKRGITTAATLASLISVNAVQLAPTNLVATITAASITAAGTGTTFTFLKFMTATHLKLGLSALAVAGAATAMVMQHQTQNRLRDESELLLQQIAQLKTDNASLSNRLTAVGQVKSLTDDQFKELLKLRGEVGVLRRQLDEFTNSQKANSQSHLEPTPEQQKQMEQVQQENRKINQARIWCGAIQQYVLEHHGLSPISFDQLRPYTPQYDTLIQTNQFEIIDEGNISKLPYPEIIIVLREKEASQIANGKLWKKYYGFADGDVKPIVSGNGNFDEFERKHMALPQVNGQ